MAGAAKNYMRLPEFPGDSAGGTAGGDAGMHGRRLRLAAAIVLGACALGWRAWAAPVDPAAAFPPNPLGIQARAGLLMDAYSGQVLYAFNEHERMQPASLAKVMTFDLILEAVEQKALSMDTKVPVSERAWRLALNNRLSNMFIEVGEQVTVSDLLKGLMVSSGNDAAVALAEYRGGSEERFVDMMNARARELGLKETRFANSHGLAADGQYTTAYDMALLARHVVLQHPEGLKITSLKEFTYAGIRQFNWNRLVLRDPRVDGLKTGHLPEAGYHLVATARDGGMRLIAVVMGTAGETERMNEAQKLLDYGFRNFATVEVDWKAKAPSALPVYKGKERSVPLEPAAPVVVTVPRGQEGRIAVGASTAGRAVAPVRKGEKLGRLTVTLAGKEIAGFDLLAARDVPRGGLLRVAWDSIRLFFARLLGR